jgi:YafQ family addiction module toxin component
MIEPYDIELSNRLNKKLRKLQSKDNRHCRSVVNKILQLSENPQLGKPLGNILKGKRRVHIGSLVLIYEIDENERLLKFLDIAHHDEAYES